MNMHPTTPPIPATHKFDDVVCLRFEEGWRYVEDGEQALECLEDRFADHHEPSWQRAQVTCAAFITDQASADAAKSAFIVAAMAAGIAFEVAESLAVVERHVEEAANDGLLTILFDENETP
jgi:hypothetical protein